MRNRNNFFLLSRVNPDSSKEWIIKCDSGKTIIINFLAEPGDIDYYKTHKPITFDPNLTK